MIKHVLSVITLVGIAKGTIVQCNDI